MRPAEQEEDSRVIDDEKTPQVLLMLFIALICGSIWYLLPGLVTFVGNMLFYVALAICVMHILPFIVALLVFLWPMILFVIELTIAMQAVELERMLNATST